jgi:opacity protein-like surface antigen
MKSKIVRITAASAAALFALIAVPASAQSRSTPSVMKVIPYVGYMKFGSFVDGPLGTRVGNAGSAIYGAQLGIDLNKDFEFVGNIGYSPTQIEVGVPILGGLRVADSKVLLYDAGLQYNLPTLEGIGSGARPFVVAGAGAMRTEVDVASVKASSTDFAFNYGAGVDVAVSERWGIRASARDYVAKLNIGDAVNVNLSTRRTHNWAFAVGAKIGL